MTSDKPEIQAGAESGELPCSAIKATKERVQGVLDNSRQVTPKEVALFGRLDKASQIPENERERFKEAYFSLPTGLRKRYLGPLKYSLDDKNPVHVLTKFRAYLFELTRRELVVEQKLELLEDRKHLPIMVDYLGYELDQKDFDSRPQKPLGGNDFGDIESDIEGIIRNNEPYIYETKLMAIKVYGKEYGLHEAAKARNQLLKYQTAIEQGKIAGATIEVKGVFDTEFFDWVHRVDTVPALEILYCLDLPSGAEYRFVLKRGREEGLRFKNTDDNHTPEDIEIISGIESVLKADSGVLRSCVAELDLSRKAENTTLTQENIDKPFQINSLDDYHTYQAIRLSAIWERFKKG
ncbi:hypothetical protein KJ662_00635 [Patescibacteria group bacterium]|nr:hypothetical protein [Patescibacteria group bacterium]MBU1684744.1 hypothetical protein [Patescibacteria group bacterium]